MQNFFWNYNTDFSEHKSVNTWKSVLQKGMCLFDKTKATVRKIVRDFIEKSCSNIFVFPYML